MDQPLLESNYDVDDFQVTHSTGWRKVWSSFSPKARSERRLREEMMACARAEELVGQLPSRRVAVFDKVNANPVVMEFITHAEFPQSSLDAPFFIFCVASLNDYNRPGMVESFSQYAKQVTSAYEPYHAVLLLEPPTEVSFDQLQDFCKQAGVDVNRVCYCHFDMTEPRADALRGLMHALRTVCLLNALYSEGMLFFPCTFKPK